MQVTRLFLLASVPLAVIAVRSRAAVEFGSDPLGKVLELLNDLVTKIETTGDKESKAYKEYFEWCDDTVQNLKFEIKTATSQKAKLEAKIGELTSEIEVGGSKIQDLVSAISSTESDLKGATSVREKEAAEFSASETELVDVIDSLERATTILERQMQKKGAAVLTQLDTSSTENMLRSLSAVVDAAGLAASDRNKLLNLVKSSDDEGLGAPDADAYQSKSGGVMDVLEDLKDKAETQLSELRKAESTAKHTYNMLKQSLNDKLDADNKDMEEEKANKAQASESKAGAEGDLEVTVKALKNSKTDLATAQSNCMQVASDHEGSVVARTEELKIINDAIKILKKTAEDNAPAFVQLQGVAASTAVLFQRSGVLMRIRRLAQKYHSKALQRLASHIATVVRYGGSADPFGKVRGLIQDLINRLENEASAEASEKEYCDTEMAKTSAKKEALEDDSSKAGARIDQAAAKSAELRSEIKELQGELSAILKEQAEMDTIRREEHEAYVAAKASLDSGLASVRAALGVLRDYYASKEEEGGASMVQEDDTAFAARMKQPAKPGNAGKSSGAGQSIIGFLEVIESDLATNLAKTETEESDQAAAYEKMSFDNKKAISLKDQDVSYKTAETKKLDKVISELSGDKENTEEELSAVNEYFGKLKERCIAKPSAYEERKARRDAEIQGLKEALTAINAPSLVQNMRAHNIRGATA